MGYNGIWSGKYAYEEKDMTHLTDSTKVKYTVFDTAGLEVDTDVRMGCMLFLDTFFGPLVIPEGGRLEMEAV